MNFICNLIYVLLYRKLDWKRMQLKTMATAWTKMNPECNWDDIFRGLNQPAIFLQWYIINTNSLLVKNNCDCLAQFQIQLGTWRLKWNQMFHLWCSRGIRHKTLRLKMSQDTIFTLNHKKAVIHFSNFQLMATIMKLFLGEKSSSHWQHMTLKWGLLAVAVKDHGLQRQNTSVRIHHTAS